MALSNRTELIETISSWLWDRQDIQGRIPDFITLAEGDIRVDMKSRGVAIMNTLEIDGPVIAIPDDVKLVRSLYDEFGPIKIVAPETIAEINNRYPSGARRAQYAAIVGVAPEDIDFLVLYSAPVPQETQTVTIIYEPELAALTEDAPTNWLLTKHPNVYLYGALKHSAPWLKDDERVALFENLYADHMSKLERLRDAVEFGAGPLVAMPRRAIGG